LQRHIPHFYFVDRFLLDFYNGFPLHPFLFLSSFHQTDSRACIVNNLTATGCSSSLCIDAHPAGVTIKAERSAGKGMNRMAGPGLRNGPCPLIPYRGWMASDQEGGKR
jgi:hypothetical protein